MLTDTMTYRHSQPSILSGVPVDLKDVRAKVFAEMKAANLNPNQLAKRAGVNQSSLNRWLDLDREMTELRARVLFQVIEKGLKKSLTEFFREIEGGTKAADPYVETIGATFGAAPYGGLVSATTGDDPDFAKRFGNALILAGAQLVRSVTGGATTESDQSMEKPRAKESRRRRGGAGNR